MIIVIAAIITIFIDNYFLRNGLLRHCAVASKQSTRRNSGRVVIERVRKGNNKTKQE